MEYGAISSAYARFNGPTPIYRLLWFQKNLHGWLDILGPVEPFRLT
jgi:hypothetical protein